LRIRLGALLIGAAGEKDIHENGKVASVS
jgi:hypothetical protein